MAFGHLMGAVNLQASMQSENSKDTDLCYLAFKYATEINMNRRKDFSS